FSSRAVRTAWGRDMGGIVGPTGRGGSCTRAVPRPRPYRSGAERGLQRRGQACSLVDGALGVEFRCHVRAADDVHGGSELGQLVGQAAARLLPRAYNDVVHVQDHGLAVDGDVPTLVVDLVVGGARA